MRRRISVSFLFGVALVAGIGSGIAPNAQAGGLEGGDLYRLRSVSGVQLSPDGTRIAYSLQKRDQPGRPYSETRIMEVASGKTTRLGGQAGAALGARWSPDGQWIAYFGRAGD